MGGGGGGGGGEEEEEEEEITDHHSHKHDSIFKHNQQPVESRALLLGYQGEN